jgi:hypothetical protein
VQLALLEVFFVINYNIMLLRITKFSRFGRAHGSLLPHHLTGRQAPLKGRALVVRFVGVVKTERYKKLSARLLLVILISQKENSYGHSYIRIFA